MTYNVQGHAAWKNGRHLERIAEVIRAARPDVVGLQEVHCRTQRSRSLDQASVLCELTGLEMYFGRSCALFGGDYGNAILTAGRLIEGAVHPLPGKGEQRSLLDSKVAVREKEIRVFVTHLSAWGRLKRREREAQVRAIAARLSVETEPFLFMGDLNVAPGAPELAPLASCTGMQHCGVMKMVTHRLTRAHYDHIYAGGSGWRTTNAEVVRRGPSDHWPVLAELTLDD